MVKNFMGKNFAEVSLASTDRLLKEIYQGHLFPYIYHIAKYKAYKSGLSCIDLGGGAGSLIKALKREAPELPAYYVNVDATKELLDADTSSNLKHCMSIQQLAYNEGQWNSYFVAMMRYVLHYNELKFQYELLSSAKSMLRHEGTFILHHAAPMDPSQQVRLHQIFGTTEVSEKLHRPFGYWSLWSEVQQLIDKLKFQSTIWERYILPIGSLFKDRYDLDSEEEERFKRLMYPYTCLEYTICVLQKS